MSKKATKANAPAKKKGGASRKSATPVAKSKSGGGKAVAKKVAPAKKAAPAKKTAKNVKAKEAKASPPTPTPAVPKARKADPGNKSRSAVAKAKSAGTPVKKSVKKAVSPSDLGHGEATSSGAVYYDSHMHTPLCKHAWGEPEEYAEQGIQAGLKGIIFTCHCPMPNGFWPMVRMSESEFEVYLKIVDRAREAFADRIDVCLGLESEFFPGCEETIAALHQRADFDYILGGLHWQAKEYLGKYETGTIELFRRTYFDHLAASAESGLYDCLAHPDLVKNYHPDSWCFAIVKPSIADALDRIAKTGVAMELNTSGLNKSYSEMNPGNEMLRMMAERSIPVVIGSDAHRPHRVGEHFPTALIQLQEAGYEKVSYFKKRERVDLPISKVLASIKKASDANA